MSLYAAATARLRRRRAPLCFLHVPKAAGTSVHVALEGALGAGAVAPRRSDTSVFSGGFEDFDRLEESARALVAVDDSEIAKLADHRVVSGHFSLPTLLRIAPPSNVATVLREPRARTLSSYMFLILTPLIEFWGPYGSEVLAPSARSLEACLSDVRFARTSDNQVCRLILAGDPRMPDGEFVAPGHAEGVAEAALERLDELGSVQILEVDDIWNGLSGFFGVPLQPVHTNVSGESEQPDWTLPIAPFDMRTVLELIEQRNLADLLVYDALLERRCGDRAEARRIADAAFAQELVRFGDLTGASATKLSDARLARSRAAAGQAS